MWKLKFNGETQWKDYMSKLKFNRITQSKYLFIK